MSRVPNIMLLAHALAAPYLHGSPYRKISWPEKYEPSEAEKEQSRQRRLERKAKKQRALKTCGGIKPRKKHRF